MAAKPEPTAYDKSYSLYDPVLDGTATYTFNDAYQLNPGEQNGFSIDYQGGLVLPGATVSGTVTSTAAFPFGTTYGVIACPGSMPIPVGGSCPGQLSTFTTDLAGDYSLNLPAGTYDIEGVAWPPGQPPVAANQLSMVEVLSAGQAISLNWTVTPATTVSGTVTPTAGFPPGTSYSVVACPGSAPILAGGNCPGQISAFVAQPSGSYSLNLTPGTYDIGAFAWPPGQPPVAADQPPIVEVLGAGQAISLNWTVTPPATVSGTLTSAGTFPPGTSYGVIACPGNAPIPPGGSCPGQIPAFVNEPSGSYSLSLAAGTYDIGGFAWPPGLPPVASTPRSVVEVLSAGQAVALSFTVIPPPTALVLAPVSATGIVGTSDTLTATLSGGGDTGQPVVFSVFGASSASGSCTTDSTGACSFAYTGPARPGSDTITACFDSNGNGQLDATDSPCATAKVTWKLPAAAVFAANTACGSANGLIVNGSHISVGGGGEHSNGSFSVNGSWNIAAYGSFGGPNGCKATVNGTGNAFQGVATPLNDPTIEPFPVDYSQQAIPCTFSAPSFTFNGSNATIPAGVYCATGTVTFNGSNDTGNVTVVAQKIVVNGSGYKLTPNVNGLLLYEKGNSQLSLNGSGSSLSGGIFAPAATIVLNGASTTQMSGPVEGLNVTLNGSNWSIS